MANIWKNIQKEAGNILQSALGGFLSKNGVITLSCGGESLIFPVVPS